MNHDFVEVYFLYILFFGSEVVVVDMLLFSSLSTSMGSRYGSSVSRVWVQCWKVHSCWRPSFMLTSSFWNIPEGRSSPELFEALTERSSVPSQTCLRVQWCSGRWLYCRRSRSWLSWAVCCISMVMVPLQCDFEVWRLGYAKVFGRTSWLQIFGFGESKWKKTQGNSTFSSGLQ